jgi:hypothetical protein
MLIVTVTITIDSEIGYVADFIPEQISSNTGVFVFILIAVIFMVTQYLILDYVKHLNKETRQRVPHLSKLHSGVFFAQYLLVGIIVVVILRILLMQQYNIISLYIVYAVSYGLWIVTLALLARAFFLWYKFSKNTMILIFTLSMIAYVINGITGLAEYSDMLGQQKNIISSTDIAYFRSLVSSQ